MRLFSPKLELRTLAEICNSPKEFSSSYLLSKLTEDHFNFKPAKVAFKRAIRLMRTKGELPSYHELEVDPVIDEDFREILSNNEYKKKKIKDVNKADDRFQLLDKYRKQRLIYESSKAALDALQGSAVDIDAVMQTMSDQIAVARAAVSTEANLIHIGKNNNSSKLVEEILDGKVEPTIPTGFKTFDDKNGGFFKPAVAILSSNSSGGKSVAALQMAINMYRAGYSTCVLSLEMSKEQYMARFLSNISGIDSNKIFLKRLSKSEKKQIKLAYKKFVLLGKKNGVMWTILAPESGMSLDQLLMTIKPYCYDVITIDYLSLLDEADTDNQARALASITRRCKLFAGHSKCLMVLLAQLSDEGLIKYSRAIKENADHVWTWVYGDTERETHLITIKVDKGRNQICFPFEVQEDYAVMRLTDNGQVRDFDDASTNDSGNHTPDESYLQEDEI